MELYNYPTRQLIEWPVFTGNNSNTFSSSDTFPVNLIQNNNIIVDASSILAVSNSIIYVCDQKQNNKLYAVELKSNIKKWQYVTQGIANNIKSIIANNNMVFLLTSSGITALTDNGISSSIKWSIQDNVMYFNYDETKIYYTVSGANSAPAIVILDSSNGKELSRISIGKPLYELGMIAVGDGRLFFTVSNKSANPLLELYSVDIVSERIHWIAGLGSYNIPSSQTSIYMDGKVYLDYEPIVTGNVSQYLIAAFDAMTGKSLWKYNIGTEFGHTGSQNRFSVNADSVITIDRAGYMISINKDNGSTHWTIQYADILGQGGQLIVTPSSGLLIATSDTIILNNNNKVKIFNASSGTILVEFSAYALNSVPVAVAEKTLILSSEKGLSTYIPFVSGTSSTKPFVSIQSIIPTRISPYEAGYSNTTIKILLSESEDIQMEVINSNSQIIRTYPYATIASGIGNRFWDGKDDKGKPVPYGRYHFGFNIKDLAGNSAYYEYPYQVVTVGDIIAVALSDISLRNGPGTQYGILKVVPTGTNINILDESGSWFKVNYFQGYTMGYIQGFIPKNQVSTYSNPVLVTVINPVQYTVQSGDTVFNIAAKFGTTAPLIISINNLKNSGNLTIGQKLLIPVLSKQPVKVIHVVVSGDSLWKISNYYKVPAELITMNNKINTNNLVIGQKLLIK